MSYKTQIWHRLKWELFDRGSKTPAPAWFCNDCGWTTDSNEIIRAIRLDDNLGIMPTYKVTPTNTTENEWSESNE